jgi:hypothetical protein
MPGWSAGRPLGPAFPALPELALVRLAAGGQTHGGPRLKRARRHSARISSARHWSASSMIHNCAEHWSNGTSPASAVISSLRSTQRMPPASSRFLTWLISMRFSDAWTRLMAHSAVSSAIRLKLA